jgi:hypothetical protein
MMYLIINLKHINDQFTYLQNMLIKLINLTIYLIINQFNKNNQFNNLRK